jgi:hypothetical protein
MSAPLKSRVGLSLQARVNIVLGGIFFVGLCLAVLSALNEEHAVAEAEVLRDARLVMDFADVTRAYTNEEVKPHIAEVEGGEFPRPAVPSFASRRVAERLTAMDGYKSITLREVAPNPMNPENLPDSFEVGLFNRFKADPQEELTGRVATVKGEPGSMWRVPSSWRTRAV